MIGPRSDVEARLRESLPDLAGLSLQRPGFVIEFDFSGDPVQSVFLRIVGGDDTVIEVIANVLAGLDLRGYDIQTGDFFEPQASLAGLRKWRAFRDRSMTNSAALSGNPPLGVRVVVVRPRKSEAKSTGILARLKRLRRSRPT